ncbi:hypothetical protein CAEBREN_19896 [Caenorhabditis brenneri]|uniref:Uncharacterized protein n=1 Tax=Caenorhabditis brenneri TaxID=135651 RepID=G0MLV8_CAEBE|nr:hypothetical protein CAEBREN_19896 [Caenorhabditis brenneri]
MGNTESSNDALVDRMITNRDIKHRRVERAFRTVERPYFLPKENRRYTTLPERVEHPEGGVFHPGPLHLSALDIYAQVLDYLQIRRGDTFLNVGAGSGYFSTLVGVCLGDTGTNHGIELYPNLIKYSQGTIKEWTMTASASTVGFAPPDIRCADVHDHKFLDAHQHRYDRIYISFRLHDKAVLFKVIKMLKIGGILVVPMLQHMTRYTRLSETEANCEVLARVTFGEGKKFPEADMPEAPIFERIPTLAYLSRQQLRRKCRQEAYSSLQTKAINKSLRIPVGGLPPEPSTPPEEPMEPSPNVRPIPAALQQTIFNLAGPENIRGQDQPEAMFQRMRDDMLHMPRHIDFRDLIPGRHRTPRNRRNIPSDEDDPMNDFNAGGEQVLLSTPSGEVYIPRPDISMIIIENAYGNHFINDAEEAIRFDINEFLPRRRRPPPPPRAADVPSASNAPPAHRPRRSLLDNPAYRTDHEGTPPAVPFDIPFDSSDDSTTSSDEAPSGFSESSSSSGPSTSGYRAARQMSEERTPTPFPSPPPTVTSTSEQRGGVTERDIDVYFSGSSNEPGSSTSSEEPEPRSSRRVTAPRDDEDNGTGSDSSSDSEPYQLERSMEDRIRAAMSGTFGRNERRALRIATDPTASLFRAMIRESTEQPSTSSAATTSDTPRPLMTEQEQEEIMRDADVALRRAADQERRMERMERMNADFARRLREARRERVQRRAEWNMFDLEAPIPPPRPERPPRHWRDTFNRRQPIATRTVAGTRIEPDPESAHRQRMLHIRQTMEEIEQRHFPTTPPTEEPPDEIELSFDNDRVPREEDGELTDDEEEVEPRRPRAESALMSPGGFVVHMGPPLSHEEMERRSHDLEEGNSMVQYMDDVAIRNINTPPEEDATLHESRQRARDERDLEINYGNNAYQRVVENLALPPILIEYLVFADMNIRPCII